MLTEKTKEFASTLTIKNYAASEGWLINFKKRNAVVFKKVCEKSGNVNNAVCLDWHCKLKTMMLETILILPKLAYFSNVQMENLVKRG